MVVADLSRGRLKYCRDTFEFVPCGSEMRESSVHLYSVENNRWVDHAFRDSAGLLSKLNDLRSLNQVFWLHLAGEIEEEVWAGLSEALSLTPTRIEHIRKPNANSLLEESHQGIFFSMIRCFFDEVVHLEFVNFCLTKNFLITRQFAHENFFRKSAFKLLDYPEASPFSGTAELVAMLIGDVVRSYIEVLSVGSELLCNLQNQVLQNPGKKELSRINSVQQLIWLVWQALWPVETTLVAIIKSRNPALSEEGCRSLREAQEETVVALRLLESYRAMSYDLMDIYVSGIGLRTNETTSVLTVIATLFLPPTLIAGIYGMNFKIPEFDLPHGYAVALACMFFVSFGLLYWLKVKGYLRA